MALLEAYGIPVAPSGIAATRKAAVTLAGALGYPVVLKADDPRIVHKSDVGGVVVDIRDQAELGRAFDRVRAAMRRAGVERGRVRIQKMIPEGVEVLLGMSRDPHLGPLVAFGLGGVLVEALEQVTFKVPPLTDRAAAELLEPAPGPRSSPATGAGRRWIAGPSRRSSSASASWSATSTRTWRRST